MCKAESSPSHESRAQDDPSKACCKPEAFNCCFLVTHYIFEAHLQSEIVFSFLFLFTAVSILYATVCPLPS